MMTPVNLSFPFGKDNVTSDLHTSSTLEPLNDNYIIEMYIRE